MPDKLTARQIHVKNVKDTIIRNHEKLTIADIAVSLKVNYQTVFYHYDSLVKEGVITKKNNKVPISQKENATSVFTQDNTVVRDVSAEKDKTFSIKEDEFIIANIVCKSYMEMTQQLVGRNDKEIKSRANELGLLFGDCIPVAFGLIKNNASWSKNDDMALLHYHEKLKHPLKSLVSIFGRNIESLHSRYKKLTNEIIDQEPITGKASVKVKSVVLEIASNTNDTNDSDVTKSIDALKAKLSFIPPPQYSLPDSVVDLTDKLDVLDGLKKLPNMSDDLQMYLDGIKEDLLRLESCSSQ